MPSWAVMAAVREAKPSVERSAAFFVLIQAKIVVAMLTTEAFTGALLRRARKMRVRCDGLDGLKG